ncbi:MAG TPA: chemotaxis protein CheA [Vicinamibacteria bacterium]
MEFQVSAELLNIYLEDARVHLEALDHGLLALERDGLDLEVVSAILGPLHTLKGNSGMMGFIGVKDYVHRLEDVLGRVRDRGLVLEASLFDLLFAGASALRDSVEHAAAAGSEGQDLLAERQALEQLMSRTPGADPLPVLQEAKARERPAPAPDAAARLDSPATPLLARKAGAEAHASVRSSMVRVDFSQLDHLLNLVGELIVYRTKLQQLAKDLAPVLVPHAAGREMIEAVHQVSGVSSQLQETIMDVRMLPIRNVFERFPRLVRDLARQQGKQVELILEGEDTRVDKAIIDELGEPLVHMIRNSVDHGIESPEVRLARGKSATGTLLLSAAQESNQVVLNIVDDGGGIDVDEVRRRAVEKGLVRADEVLSDKEAVQLIFSEGFSTARTVTDLSGRGVGLDVVLKSIEKLNGLVEAESLPGAGTKFTIQLPLTLAIIAALMVEVGGETYAVPLGSVVESIRFRPLDIVRINGHDTLRLRDRIVPLLHLARAFGIGPANTQEGAFVVVLGRGEKRLGLVVERLLGQQEIVIKALDPVVSGAAFAVAGATILGNGRVVLILDVAALFEGRRHGALAGRLAAGVLA